MDKTVLERPTTDKITFRRAGIEDYDDVINIRHGIYNGLDYLPALYKSMMVNHLGYVGVCDGQIVVFECVILVDDGETMVSKSLRVKKDMEGLGLVRMMKDYIYQDIKRITTLKRHALSFSERHPGLLWKLAEGKAELVIRQDMLHFMSIVTELAGLIPRKRSPFVRPMTKQDLVKLFARSSCEIEELFPDQRLIIKRVPYRCVPSNVDIFVDDSSLIIGSGSHIAGSERLALITLGYVFVAQIGVVYTLSIFGQLTEELFSYHIAEHIKKCLCFESNTVVFAISYQGEIHDAGTISKIMRRYGMSDVSSEHDIDALVIEEAFPRNYV